MLMLQPTVMFMQDQLRSACMMQARAQGLRAARRVRQFIGDKCDKKIKLKASEGKDIKINHMINFLQHGRSECRIRENQ